jgi:hypothetical protein
MAIESNTNGDVSVEILADNFSAELAKLEPTRQQRVLRKVILAALGSIPWVGGFMSALATIKEDEAQAKTDNLQKQWRNTRVKLKNSRVHCFK